MDLNEELVDDGQILDSLRPGRQLLGVAVGQTTPGVLDLDEEVGFELADGLFSAEEDFEFVAFDIDLDKNSVFLKSRSSSTNSDCSTYLTRTADS